MNKKSRFNGYYYKIVSKDNKESLAIIISYINRVKTTQVIYKNRSYILSNSDSYIDVSNDHTRMYFHMKEDGLIITGTIFTLYLDPPSKDIMSFYKYLNRSCIHKIVSLYHEYIGDLFINGQLVSFKGYRGYIEGDEGHYFPKEYIWYNSVNKFYTLTLAIAKIHLFHNLINFVGILCILKDRTRNKEYYLSTYNKAKVIDINEKSLSIKAGKYKLDIEYELNEEEKVQLLSPNKGEMEKFTKEGLRIKSKYTLFKKEKPIIFNNDNSASMEYMWKHNKQ